MSTPVSAEPASPAQLSYLRGIAARRAMFGGDLTPEQTSAKLDELIAAGLTRDTASALIDAGNQQPLWSNIGPATGYLLNALRDRAETHAVYGLTVDRDETKVRLEARIAEGLTGEEARTLLHAWYTAKPHPSAKTPLAIRHIPNLDDIEVWEGCFAVVVEGQLRFYRVYVPPTGEFKDDLVIRRFAGDNLLALYPGEAETALRTIFADPNAAAYRFADEHTRCMDCTRKLTDAVSRLMSIGPNCRGFASHSGLREAAQDIDTNAARKNTYRALHEFALARGFRDPRNKEERERHAGEMTAVRFAAAWSGVPALLDDTADAARALVESLMSEDAPEAAIARVSAAPPDTLVEIINTGVLSGPLLQSFSTHPNQKVAASAAELFMSLLT